MLQVEIDGVRPEESFYLIAQSVNFSTLTLLPKISRESIKSKRYPL